MSCRVSTAKPKREVLPARGGRRLQGRRPAASPGRRSSGNFATGFQCQVDPKPLTLSFSGFHGVLSFSHPPGANGVVVEKGGRRTRFGFQGLGLKALGFRSYGGEELGGVDPSNGPVLRHGLETNVPCQQISKASDNIQPSSSKAPRAIITASDLYDGVPTCPSAAPLGRHPSPRRQSRKPLWGFRLAQLWCFRPLLVFWTLLWKYNLSGFACHSPSKRLAAPSSLHFQA